MKFKIIFYRYDDTKQKEL